MYQLKETSAEHLFDFAVFASCDSNYFMQHAEAFIASVELNSPGNAIVLHVINPSEQVQSEIVRIKGHLHSTNLTILEEYVDLDDCTEDEKRTYYASYRFVAASYYMQKSQRDLYISDIDAYVRKNLFIMRRQYEDYDLTLKTRLELEFDRKLLAGSILIKFNDRTVSFLSDVAKSIEKKAKRNRWMADQISLYECLVKHSVSLDIAQLDAKFIDWRMGDASSIWSAKGDKKESPKFIKYGHEVIRRYSEKGRTLILAPRIDHAFKETIAINKEDMAKRVKEPVRVYWLYFGKILQAHLEKAGEKVEYKMLPAWEITQEYIESLDYDTIYVPHKSHHQIKDDRCIFYMQELYSPCFTVDKQGWAASSSKHKSYEYVEQSINQSTIDYIEKVKSNKVSKYEQLDTKVDYDFDVFFPLQIPHDQTLEFHSKYELKEIVEFAIKWAVKNKVKILFKKHPFGKKLKYLDKSLLKSKYVKVIEGGDIHDLIQRAKVVFVANSGVGLESLFYYKPVVNFADAIYDVISFNCDLAKDDLNFVYKSAKTVSKDAYQIECQKFLQWYLFEQLVDITKDKISIPVNDQVFTSTNTYQGDIELLSNPIKEGSISQDITLQGKEDGVIGYKKYVSKVFPGVVKKRFAHRHTA